MATYPALRHVLICSLLSNIGMLAQQVAQLWLLPSMGASRFLLGVDAFVLVAPVFLLTLVAGAVADSSERRRNIILKFQSLQMLFPTVIVLLPWSHAVQPWMVIALSLIVGITGDGLSMHKHFLGRRRNLKPWP